MKTACFLAASALVAAAAGAQTQVTLIATDSKCIDAVDGDNLNDNRMRAYTWTSVTPGPGFQRLFGLVKFDASSIPDNASIDRMELTTFHEEGFSNPFQGPEVRVYRYADHRWARTNTNDPFSGFGEELTPVMTGFPSGDLVPVVWQLDAAAADWTPDLFADSFSLGIYNELTTYSYVYFYGSGPTGRPPELTITYTDGCYPDCTGEGTLDIFDFLCFQDAFVQMDPYADCDGNTTFDIFDFLCFQDAFVTGCP